VSRHSFTRFSWEDTEGRQILKRGKRQGHLIVAGTVTLQNQTFKNLKATFSNTPIGRLRVIGLLEGLSFLLLLGIAMPLKYMAGMPLMVKYVGWAHGLLFVLYLAAVMQATLVHRWSLLRVAGAVVASLVPLGPFILDGRLRKEEEARKHKAAKQAA
jgi:integral membrane protein